MTKKISLTLSFLLFSLIATAQIFSREEREIYRLTIDSVVATNYVDTLPLKLCVITREMEGHNIPSIESIRTKEFKFGNDTYDDFRNKTLQTITFKYLDSRLPVRYISADSIASIFDTKKGLVGWSEFYKRYPNSQGILTLSAIGFNKDRTEAIIYYGNQYDYDGGAGYYAIYRFDGKSWVLSSKKCIWIS